VGGQEEEVVGRGGGVLSGRDPRPVQLGDVLSGCRARGDGGCKGSELHIRPGLKHCFEIGVRARVEGDNAERRIALFSCNTGVGRCSRDLNFVKP